MAIFFRQLLVVTPAGSSEVAAAESYSYNFEGPGEIIGDHSGKYYAVYLRALLSHSNTSLEIIPVWDIESGKAIQCINGPFLHKSPGGKLTTIIVAATQGRSR